MQASLIIVCQLVLYIADSRGIVMFCIIRLWFRLWGCTLVCRFSPFFLPCVTSPVSPLPSITEGWMDGWCFLLSLFPLDPWSAACPIQTIPYPYSTSLHSSLVTCPPVLADHFTMITSVSSQLIFRPAYSLLLFLLFLPVLTTVSLS